MRRQNSFWIVLVLIFSWAAKAQVDRSPLKIKTPSPEFDLLKENESITVLGEQSVQTHEPESRHLLNFFLGSSSANNLTLTANGTSTQYDFKQASPMMGVGFGYYPAFFNGRWGLLSSIGYAYREQENPTTANSALHMFATDVLVSYRYEYSAHSWVKPYVGVGPGVNIVIQRGIDELNTSEAKGLIVGAVGMGFNIKRLFNMSSPLDWEMNVQYKQWFDNRVSNADYNGSLMSVGFSMIL